MNKKVCKTSFWSVMSLVLMRFSLLSRFSLCLSLYSNIKLIFVQQLSICTPHAFKHGIIFILCSSFTFNCVQISSWLLIELSEIKMSHGLICASSKNGILMNSLAFNCTQIFYYFPVRRKSTHCSTNSLIWGTSFPQMREKQSRKIMLKPIVTTFNVTRDFH